MPGFSVLNIVGIDINSPFYGSALASAGYVQNSTPIPPFRVGEQTIATDGRLYVFGSVAVGQNIASGATTVTVAVATTGTGPYATTTAVATAGGGTYVAPTFTGTPALGATGGLYPDFAWFGATGKLAA